MSYVLQKSNGQTFVTIQDGSIDNSSSLTFIGQNYAGYGQILQQDLLYMLENFSNITSPTNPVQGQLWFDSGKLKLKVYDGTDFKGISFTTLSTGQPTTAQEGDFWFNTVDSTLSIKVGSTFTKISGGGVSSGSGLIAVSVKDTDGNSHSILKTVINSSVVSIFSYDSFAVNTTESIYSNFSYIKTGLTLANSDSIGRSTSNTAGIVVWGTAATSLTSDKLLVDSTSTFFSATTGTTANTVVARGNLGEIRATNFYNDIGVIGQGYWGSVGYSGSRGAGYTGSNGLDGYIGSQGGTGPTGPLGYTGSGAGGGGSGYTGSASTSIGYTGSAGGGGGGAGYWGSVGYIGSKGTGYTGSQGSAASAAPPVLFNVTAPYTAGGRVYTTSTQPTATNIGDVWFDTAVSSSLATNGWAILPTGIKIAWGYATVSTTPSTTITYASGVNFSTVFGVQLTIQNSSANSGSGGDLWAQLVSFGTTSFVAMLQSSNSSGLMPVYYLAYGA
jgi:hypothetical protein